MGVVYLRGVIRTEEAKQAATEAAERVQGVWEVDHSELLTESAVARAVRDALVRDRRTTQAAIDVTCVGGTDHAARAGAHPGGEGGRRGDRPQREGGGRGDRPARGPARCRAQKLAGRGRAHTRHPWDCSLSAALVMDVDRRSPH